MGKILKGFEGIYARELLSIHRQKLGLKTSEDGDQKLVDEWISCMKIAEADLTMSWRQLSEISDQDLFEVTNFEFFASFARISFKCAKSGITFVKFQDFWFKPALKLRERQAFQSKIFKFVSFKTNLSPSYS